MSVAPGEPGPRSRAMVAFALRWGAWLWTAALLLAIPATGRTAQLYLHLRSELEQLLPRNAPSVLAIEELRARLPGLQHLGVVVDCGASPGSLPAAERFLDDLAARARAYPPGLVSDVRTGDGVERRFLEDHAALYLDVADLEEIQRRVEARRDWEASKEQGALLDEDQPPPALDFDDIQHKYDERSSAARHFDGDHFASAELHTALLLIEVGEFETGHARGEALVHRVEADIAALDPERYAAGLRVGFAGDVAIHVEETQALVSDLSVSSAMVIVLVVAVIVLYYRWWRSILILLPPLLLATVYSFALASLPPFRVTELNSNTAFLGSIIVGNGINFGIVLLARYVEERRRGAGVQEALVLGVWGARTGTLAAALAAGVSYASLALTDFRGFRQFGFIGGIGMVLSWLLAFVLMPPLARWVDRGPDFPSREGPAVMAGVVRLVQRRRGLLVALGLGLAACAVWEARSFGSDPIETDFSKLRRADTWTRGEGYWGRKMDAVLGSYVTPAVILTDDADQARAVGRVLRDEVKAPPLDRLLASVRTIDDVVPRDQEAKIRIAEAIDDDLTPKVRQSLTGAQQKWVDRLLGQGALHPIGPADVPATFTTGLRERDGTMGREVLAYPRPSHLLWEGAPLAALVDHLRAAAKTRARPTDRPGRVASSLALSEDILDSVRRDGVRASVAAFAGVVGVVLLLLRASPATLLVIGSLLLGVLYLVGGMMALGVKINFANFIAYPITFGIGVDYSVNMASRWDLDGRRSMADAIRTTGGAVTLCSLTTIIGYSSLLLAQNRALFLFGLLAVMGEAACLSTAVLFLPAFVEWVGGGDVPASDPGGAVRTSAANWARAGPPWYGRKAMVKVVSFNLDAAWVEGMLSKGTRRVTCREVKEAGAIFAAEKPPHLVLLSGDAGQAADAAEALMDDATFLATPLVGWRVEGKLADTSRLIALGVQIVEGDEDALRAACAEALDARDGRTLRIDPPAAMGTAASEVLELYGRRVVVADDDPAITWFISDLLRAQGCDVTEACDGAVALDLSRGTMPDLVVSDIRMPRLDGFRLCRILRADPLLADVPVLLLSWKQDWLQEARQSGVEASAYLSKRATPEEILARVLDVLGPHARLERRLRQPGPARGLLDGACPYRLLRLACATHPDCRLTVRCADKAYEVQIREGAPRAALRMSADCTVARGIEALGSLLEERSGRYGLHPELGAVDAELLGTLPQQIAASVARVRRALAPPEMPAAADVASLPAADSSEARLPPRPAFDAREGAALARPRRLLQLDPPRPIEAASLTAPLTAAGRVPVKTVPLRRRPAGSELPPPRRRLQPVPLRWLGLAAVAALGIVLGAGARALRHPRTPAPVQAQAGAAHP